MNSLLLAMRVSRYLPRSVVRAGAWAGANVGWLRNGRSRQRLEANLHRVTGLSGRELSRLSRQGLITSARYYAEVLEMPRITPSQADARVRILNPEPAIPAIHEGGGTVIALGHCGNWDMVGYTSTRAILPVTSVAEVLKPREVFDEFVALRNRIGIRIYGHEGSATFRELLREAKGSQPRIIALVSDRDLSGSGIEVTMWGQRVKVAPGAAAVAKAANRPLLPLMVYSERLRGARRRSARSRWGYVMHFGPVLQPRDFDGPDAVAELSQAWTAWLAQGIAEHPQDWHMLQRFGWMDAVEEAT
ncbi:phosphatidylinositol mannoside acyltransferase [Demequina sp.]|uniref:phosphatidylinositol mannoside acyltransferase n=1 Tax=Demequina sp. TaxID=2050685 RepID=UPI003D0AD796